jgi:hypothetical protein
VWSYMTPTLSAELAGSMCSAACSVRVVPAHTGALLGRTTVFLNYSSRPTSLALLLSLPHPVAPIVVRGAAQFALSSPCLPPRQNSRELCTTAAADLSRQGVALETCFVFVQIKTHTVRCENC